MLGVRTEYATPRVMAFTGHDGILSCGIFNSKALSYCYHYNRTIVDPFFIEKGALKMAALGFKVKELLGGLDWWRRDGYETHGNNGQPGKEIKCDC